MAAVVIRSEQRDSNSKDNTSRETNGLSRDASEKVKQSHVPNLADERPQVDKDRDVEDKNDSASAADSNVEVNAERKPTSKHVSSSVVYDVEHLATFSTAQNKVKLPQTSNKTQLDVERTSTNKLSNGKQLTASSEASNYSDDNSNDSSDGRNEEHLEKLCLANLESECREPRQALQKLFMLEKFSGIWTQRMQIKLKGDLLLIIDCETNATVERFHRDCVIRPEAISHYNDIYNNIIVFVIQQHSEQAKDSNLSADELKSEEEPRDCEDLDKLDGELHIFQCVSHKAQQLVSDILNWKKVQQTSKHDLETKMVSNKSHDDDICSQENEHVGVGVPHRTSLTTATAPPTMADHAQKRTTNNKTTDSNSRPMVTVASSASNNDSLPIANVNVRETVQVFNQIAALREKRYVI